MWEIPPHSLYAMLVVFGLLVTATTCRLTLKRLKPEEDYTELRQRIQSWWWMIGILFLCLIVSRTTAIILFAFISFLALKEFFSIVPTRQADRRVLFWAYLSIPVQYYLVSIGWYGLFIIFIPVYLFLFLPMRMVLIGETRGFIHSAGIIHWARHADCLLSESHRLPADAAGKERRGRWHGTGDLPVIHDPVQ